MIVWDVEKGKKKKKKKKREKGEMLTRLEGHSGSVSRSVGLVLEGARDVR